MADLLLIKIYFSICPLFSTPAPKQVTSWNNVVFFTPWALNTYSLTMFYTPSISLDNDKKNTHFNSQTLSLEFSHINTN